jgi:hypothetical protein
MPSRVGFKPNTVVKSAVVPAITAVSKPNSRPPRAATTVLLRRKKLTLMKANRYILAAGFWEADSPIYFAYR